MLTTFKKEIQAMVAKSRSAYLKGNARQLGENRKNRKYSKEEIERIVEDGTAVEQCELSNDFFRISGLYKRIILHYATYLTYSWIMVPHVRRLNDKLSDRKNQKVYFEATDFCSSFGIEKKCAEFAKIVLVDGGYYGLIHDNGTNIVIQNLPFEFCRSRYKNSQDIDIVEFDVRFFDTIRDESLKKQVLKTYPRIIQKGYWDYNKSKKDPWIFLPAKLGIYFCFFEERPFFLDLIPLIDDLEDYRELGKEKELLSLKNILVQESPREGMNVVFEPGELGAMHEGVLDMLENNPDVDVISTYNKIHLLNLGNTQTERTDLEKQYGLIFQSAGVSKELFCATTDAGIDYSLNNDLAMMMFLGNSFAHFFTALINNKFSNRRLSFSLLILPVSYYNSSEYTSRAKDLAAFGYSFLTPILSTGMNQTNLADLKNLENEVLNLDEILKPLQSAYTQSSKTNAVTAQAAKDSEGQNQSSSSSALSGEEGEEKTPELEEERGDKNDVNE